MIELDVRLPLAHFTLEVRCSLAANVTAIVGPSGSGKTSLVESIAGLRRASGRITIDDATLLDTVRGIDLPPEQRSVGYVPQDAALFPHLRVAENIRFGNVGRTLSPTASVVALESPAYVSAANRFDALVAVLELSPLLNRVPASLSGGERQRVALARALMTKPRLLLLDEPLASIDHPLRERILLYLRRVRDLGVPMIYVTHQPFEALALSSWCVVLRDGRVAAEGPSRNVLADPELAGSVDNVFEVFQPHHDRDLGITRVTTSDGLALVLPYDQVVEATFPLIVRIRADDIVVFGERPSSISSRNVFEGTVASLRTSEGVVDLTVTTPAPLTVRITRAAAQDLGLVEGSRVWLALRSRAFRIVG
ncbi:MAG: molybdenum ABC transporter ATP-binding protein [Acidobacteriota bacterium]|nr:molybdenum ABC transporter ATP-binding protein [Acidobacteriota bacterium]